MYSCILEHTIESIIPSFQINHCQYELSQVDLVIAGEIGACNPIEALLGSNAYHLHRMDRKIN